MRRGRAAERERAERENCGEKKGGEMGREMKEREREMGSLVFHQISPSTFSNAIISRR